jgi:hypothetical protein
MKTSFSENALGRCLSIDPFNDGTERFRCLISVRQDASITDWKWREAEVNWSAIGGTSVEQTKQFADALTHAATMASWWNLQCAGQDCRGAPGVTGMEGERHDNRGPQGPQENP